MSLSIIQQPSQYRPAYHPIQWKLDSTIKSNNEFKYIFKLQGPSGVNTFLVSPRPVDGYGVFDVMRHIQDYFTQEDWDIKQNSPLAQSSPFAQYNLQIGEQYKDGAGNLIVTLGTVFNNQIGFNSVFNRNDYLTYNQSKYLLTSSASLMLWNIEDKTQVHKKDLFFIHLLTVPNTNYEIETIQTNKNGSTLVGGGTGFTFDFGTLFKIDLAAQLSFPDNAVSFSIQFKQLGSPVSEVRTLNLIDSCSIFKEYKFLYLDKHGSYSSLVFEMVSERGITVDPKMYRKYIDDGTAEDISRPLTRYYVESTEVYTVNTNILTDKHNSMLFDLIESKQVFLNVENDPDFDVSIRFLPVEILTKTMQEAKSINQDMLQKSIRFRFSYDRITR